MPSSVLSLILALIVASLVAGGCQKVVKSLGEISKLHAAIVKEYGEKDVGVNLNNNTTLSVTFINSPLNAKDREERAKRAEQTAVFVTQHFPSIDQIQRIWVSFVRQETRYVIVHYSESLDTFGFDKNAQPLSPPSESPPSDDPDSSMRATAVYFPTLNQTDVRIARLQLEGDLNFGLAVAPHFTVPGDATGLRRSPSPPQSVTFDFASYSEKSLFPGEPKITFFTDGKVLFETAGQFSTSKADDKFFESLSLQIPYAAFRRMIAQKKLTLTIGDREYEFTGEQLKALREMTQYVSE